MTDERGKARDKYWRANLKVLGILLSVWFIAGYVLGILAVEQLNKVKVGGFPLGFWFAQQGSIYIFILLILIYSIWMKKIDNRLGADGGGEQ